MSQGIAAIVIVVDLETVAINTMVDPGGFDRQMIISCQHRTPIEPCLPPEMIGVGFHKGFQDIPVVHKKAAVELYVSARFPGNVPAHLNVVGIAQVVLR